MHLKLAENVRALPYMLCFNKNGRFILIADIRANYSKRLPSLQSGHNVSLTWSNYSRSFKHYQRLL